MKPYMDFSNYPTSWTFHQWK